MSLYRQGREGIWRTRLRRLACTGAVVVLPCATVARLSYAPAAAAVGPSPLAVVGEIDTADLGIAQPTALAYSPSDRALTITGVTAGKVMSVKASLSGDLVASKAPVVSARRSAVNPRDGLRYAPSADGETLVATTASGAARSVYDLEAAGVAQSRALVFAPSADATDDPSTMSLYVASDGQVLEVSTTPVPLAAAPQPSVLVQTIDASAWAPPAPDTSGIVFMSDVGQLVASDSEVEEQTGAGYQGVNLWRFQTNGNVTATGTTFPTFSAEPTGLGYRLADRALLVSDDNQDRITFVLPGPDAIHGTADDTRTSFSTRPLSDDPEDVAYDSASGDVFILDGENKEVYRVARGPNGVFGDGDDVWSNFDVEQYGARDPEGIEYDAVNDSLLVVDQRSHVVYELTKAGGLLGTIDIRPTGSLMAAGIALAPSSIHPNRTNLWIVDRGVDNGPDPNENDGKVYELSVGTAGNTPPVVDSVAIDQTAPLTNDTLTASVTGHDDDDDPIAFRYQWRKNGTAIPDETASTLDLSVAGNGDKGDAISLRVVAFDGIVESSPLTSAQVTVANSPPLADAGADQTVNSGANFTLDATGSSDPDQEPLTYLWEQVSGPPAVIRDPNAAQTVVEGVTGPATLDFRVTATDTSGSTGTDSVLVTVRAPK